MYKLITFVVAAIPVVLFVKAIFIDKSKKRAQALANFMKELDFAVSVILFVFACAIVYSIVKLILG
jgi:hypothetical protein